jgi:hypothetical protein
MGEMRRSRPFGCPSVNGSSRPILLKNSDPARQSRLGRNIVISSIRVSFNYYHNLLGRKLMLRALHDWRVFQQYRPKAVLRFRQDLSAREARNIDKHHRSAPRGLPQRLPRLSV